MIESQFRFDPDPHTYIDLESGEEIPHITGMLAQTGWIDDRFYTEQSSERGTAVHRLTADFDLGAVHLATCVAGEYRPYLLAHVKVVTVAQLEMIAVEQPLVHPRLHFGGRPDRLMRMLNRRGVWEIKTGAPEKSHSIQTALQAILAEIVTDIPAEHQARYACYLTAGGKAKVEEHKNRRDFDEARRIVRECCGT